MIAGASRPHSASSPSNASSAADDWRPAFLRMLPAIQKHARISFRDLNPTEREEAVQEVIADALVAFVRLFEQGRAEVASWSTLADYAVRHYRSGRRTGTPLNVHDVSSGYCQCRKGVRVERLDRYDEQEGGWQEVLVEDRTCTPGDLAASRIDFAEFLATLPARNRQIAETLASGETTSEVARLFRLSRARVSQLRGELHQAWRRFQGEEAGPVMAWT